MSLEKQPFRSYDDTDEEKKEKSDVVSLWLNSDDREKVEVLKRVFEQERDGTAIKQAIEVAYAFLVGDEKTKALLAIVFKNKRNNKRHGIVTFDALG